MADKGGMLKQLLYTRNCNTVVSLAMLHMKRLDQAMQSSIQVHAAERPQFPRHTH